LANFNPPDDEVAPVRLVDVCDVVVMRDVDAAEELDIDDWFGDRTSKVNTAVSPARTRASTTATATTVLTRGPPLKDKFAQKAEDAG
jgi:hypothetical protein